MDDLEFRRRILSDPKHRDKEVLQALAGSDANNKFVEDVLDLDIKIKQAMNIDVPEDLADKILFSQTSSTLDSKVLRPNFMRKAMALAASVAFTAGLLVGQINWGELVTPPAYASLADTAIEHVITESPFVNTLDENVSHGQLNTKLQPFHYQFSGGFPYHVYYLNHCGFGEENAIHLVFQGEKGKVTLFLTGIPSDKPFDFNQQGMIGIVQPVGEASMILVGNQGEDMAAIASTLIPLIQPMN
ncbi:DUF3379 domain-containing protein [Vibrio sp. CAU 1672]|uniref:DUF3379 domain-containing protein n=1 Tax=Vibrio sp. CAU 1672 TaxID=3032594 RepID=UPI0023DAF1C2|nr:DUF3379 domain-containing protein [Vibrio sp. CAU 1672]MDF2153769.1 DUF3379 domain-containing protein [Vibrio sp. CAU 1672]